MSDRKHLTLTNPDLSVPIRAPWELDTFKDFQSPPIPEGAKDLRHREFGKLHVNKLLLVLPRGVLVWDCFCSCGGQTAAKSSQLLNGKKKSCGCLVAKSPESLRRMQAKQLDKMMAKMLEEESPEVDES